MFYEWFQLLHAIPNQRKRIIKTTNDLSTTTVYFDHHLVKNNRIIALEKLPWKEIHSLIISQNMSTPTSQQHFKTLFPHLNLDWKIIYLLSQILIKNTSLRAFQYKVLNDVFWIMSFSSLGLARLLCVYIEISMMKLYNIFSALANKLFHY